MNEGRNDIDDELEDLINDKNLVTDLMLKAPIRLTSYGAVDKDLTLIMIGHPIAGENHYDINVDDLVNYFQNEKAIKPGKEEEFKNKLNHILGK